MSRIALALAVGIFSVGLAAQQSLTPTYLVGSFLWSDGTFGQVRLSQGYLADYVVHVVITAKSGSGHPVRMPRTETIRLWLLTGAGGTLETAFRPKDGTTPTQEGESGDLKAVFGPFQFKAGPQPIAIALKVEGLCYLVPVVRSGGSIPSQPLFDGPKPCSN